MTTADGQADSAAHWTDAWLPRSLTRLGQEFDKWSEELQSRGQTFRANSRQQVEEHLEEVQVQLRSFPALRRAESLRQEIGERVEKNFDTSVDRIYERLQLARVDGVQKLERKGARLTKKLRALDKQQDS